MTPSKLKIGCKVRSKMPTGEEGVVTEIYKHNPTNPIEEHGTIEFRVTKSNGRYPVVGELEHYVEHNWQDFLEVID